MKIWAYCTLMGQFSWVLSLWFQVIAGSAGFLLAALTVGSVGGICALANVLPRPVCDLVSLHRDNKTVEARRLQVTSWLRTHWRILDTSWCFVFAASSYRSEHGGNATIWSAGPQASDGLVWILRRPDQEASAAPQRGPGRWSQGHFQGIWFWNIAHW